MSARRKENTVTFTQNHLPGLALVLALLGPATGQAEHPVDHLHLSPGLTRLLQQEMQAIQQGMQSLIPAIVSGDHEAIAETGDKIQHSYIMSQQLSAQHMQELQQLPPAFRTLDQSFHRYAGMLAHAARMQNAEVVNFYFYKLTDACVACHSRFAANRFPDLAPADSAGEQHH